MIYPQFVDHNLWNVVKGPYIPKRTIFGIIIEKSFDDWDDNDKKLCL